MCLQQFHCSSPPLPGAGRIVSEPTKRASAHCLDAEPAI
jgi:hypothetical protein